MGCDPNEQAQVDAYAEAALLAAKQMKVPPLHQYDAAEWGLMRLQHETYRLANEATDHALVLTLVDRAILIEQAIIDVRGRRRAFQAGVSSALLMMPAVEPDKGAE